MSIQQLRKFVHTEAEKLSKTAFEQPDAVNDEQVERLERLAQIVTLSEKTGPKIKPKRWPTIVIMAATTLVVSALLFFRVPTTDVELDLTLSEVQFRLSKEAPVTNVTVLTALGISELKEIRLPRSRGQSAQTYQAADYQDIGSALRVSTVNAGNAQSTLTLTTLLLPAGTLVKLSRTEISHQYRLLLAFPELPTRPVELSVKGRIHLAPSGAPAAEYQFSIPGMIQLFPASNQLTLDLTLPEQTATEFLPNLPAKQLHFVRFDQFMGTTDTLIREVSTILSGKLYLTELNNKEYALRTSERLQFATSFGSTRSLALQDDEIHLQFHGTASGMTTGWEENRQNLMPNWLEWVAARPGLMLLWSQTVSLSLLLLGIWRWWKTTG